MLRTFAVPACCAVLLLLACSGSNTPGTIAFTHVNVIPVDSDGVRLDQTVIIRDGRIASIGDADEVRAPRGATVVDGRNRWLLPSFVDTHVHFEDPGDLDVFLAHGVGAIRNLEGDTYHVHVRELLRTGEMRGPMLFTSGPYTNAPRIDTPETARAAVAEHAAAGYDFIKLHGDMNLDVLAALGEAAAAAAIPVVGHVPRDQRLEQVLELGVMREIAHAEEYLYTFFAHRRDAPFEASIPEAVEITADANVVVTPTLVTYRSIGRQVQNLERELDGLRLEYLSPFVKRNIGPERNRYTRRFETADTTWLFSNLELQMQLVTALQDGGVTLTAGTDANSPTNVPGVSLHDEMELLVEAGLTPLEVLRAGTVNGWRLVTGDPEAGRIAEGAAAELVLLEADPRANIRNTRGIAGIVSHGAWYPADTLQSHLGQLATQYELEQPFVNALWDNDISGGLELFAEAKATDDNAFVCRRDALITQAFRAMRDGAPETAVETLDLLVEQFGPGPLEQRMREDVVKRAALNASNFVPSGAGTMSRAALALVAGLFLPTPAHAVESAPPTGTWAGGFWIGERCIPYIVRVDTEAVTLDRIDGIQPPEMALAITLDGDSLRIQFSTGGDDPWEFVLKPEGSELSGYLIARTGSGEYSLPAVFTSMDDVRAGALAAHAGLYEGEDGALVRISPDEDGTLIAHFQEDHRFQMLFPSGAADFFAGDGPTRATPTAVAVTFSDGTLEWTEADTSRTFKRITEHDTPLTLIDDVIARGDLSMPLARIPAGTFSMGQHLSNDETVKQLGLTLPEDVVLPEPEPLRRTTLSKPFLMSRFEATNEWFSAFVRETGYMTDAERAGYGLVWNGEGFDRTPGITWHHPGVDAPADAPVVFVSWNDATAFTKWMTERLGRVVRLPTEAEWEYACAAGTVTTFSSGNDTLRLDEHAWSSRNATVAQPVGSKSPNPWGLHDMHGNVWEWCADGYEKITADPVVDPIGAPESRTRVLRGGSWINGPWSLRTAFRAHESPTLAEPHIGFRCVVEVE